MMKQLSFVFILIFWICICFAVVGVARAESIPLSACNPIGTPHIEYKPLGRHLVFVCTDDTKTKIYPHRLMCLHAVCDVNGLAAAAVRVAMAADYKKAVDTEWAAAVKWDCDAPPDDANKALCVEGAAWISANWATWTKDFKPAVWKVKTNGTATTRPAYALVNGVLGAKEVARATVGTICDLTKPTAPATNGDVRAEFGTAGVVTICAKVK